MPISFICISDKFMLIRNKDEKSVKLIVIILLKQMVTYIGITFGIGFFANTSIVILKALIFG